jgi:uncharacterized 2Fe-2S/4Fe-4S cluster protein (DUF4445 family)
LHERFGSARTACTVQYLPFIPERIAQIMPVDVDFQPIGRHVQVEPGSTILEAAQMAGIGLSAVCGGGGSCGTCLVRLETDAPVSPVNLVEQEELDPDTLAAGLRLACQAQVYGPLRVNVPAESLTAAQRTQVEGEEQPVALSPAVTSFSVDLPPASQEDLRADWERLSDALVGVGAPRPVSPSVHVLETLPALLRQHGWRASAVLRGDEVVSVTPPDTALLGLAVDIGTTKVAAYLVDLVTGETLAMRGLMNPQIAYGEDVMARIAYTINHADGLQTLQREIIDALNALTRDLCAEAATRVDNGREPDPGKVVDAVIVGNTAMHHLLLGLPVKQLGLAPYVAAVSAPLDIEATEIGLELADGASVHTLPNIAGFVGADHVSMLLATNAHLPDEDVVVRLDIGTNTEITLSANGQLIACSTASGPAFEGAHIRDGMRAAEGAIERVRMTDGKVEYQAIGEGAPVGICGSGILDAIAQLKLGGVLNRRGAMDRSHPLVREGENGPEVLLAPAGVTGHGRDIVLNRKDVSEIQLSKGAIRAGIELLLQHVGLSANEIDRFIIAGAFGTYIDVASAMSIGMFPSLPLERFRQVGNAAGIGAKLSLLSRSLRAEAADLAGRVEYLELTNHPDFTGAFAKAMSL